MGKSSALLQEVVTPEVTTAEVVTPNTEQTVDNTKDVNGCIIGEEIWDPAKKMCIPVAEPDLDLVEDYVGTDGVGEEVVTSDIKEEVVDVDSFPVDDRSSENTTSIAAQNNIGANYWQNAIERSKKQYKKDSEMYPAEDMFWMTPADFGWGSKEDQGYTEENVVDMMLRKYGGIGLEIKVSGVGTSKFIIGDKEVSLGDAWTDLWNPSLEMNHQQRAETVNGMVQIFLDEKEANDPSFDKEMYMEAYKHAALKTDGNSVNFNEIPVEDLTKAMQSSYNVLLENYAKTEEGAVIFQEIEVEKQKKYTDALASAIENHIDDPQEFMEYLQESYEQINFELYMGPKSRLQKFNYNSGAAVENYFSKAITLREVDANLEERYGFLSNWKFGTAVIKGFDVTLPKELAYHAATLAQSGKNKDSKAVENLFKKTKNLSNDVLIDKNDPSFTKMWRQVFNDQQYPYANMLFDENTRFEGVYEFGLKKGFKIPVKGTYKLITMSGGVKGVSKKQIEDFIQLKESWRNMRVFGKIMDAQKLKALEDTLTNKNDHFIDKDGNLNITSENYSKALGDQGFRLITSAMSFGLGSFVMETAGVVEQALQERLVKIPGFNDLSPEEQAVKTMMLLDTHPEIVKDAFKAGGLNGALDMFSNAVFFGLASGAKTGLKNLANNMDDILAFVLQQEIKQAYKVIAAGGKKVLGATMAEVVTEGLQEFNTSRAVKGYGKLDENWDFGRDAKDPVLQAMLTAFLTTPVLGGGSGVVRNFSKTFRNHVSRSRSPENILKTAKAHRQSLSKDFKAGFIIDENGNKVAFTEKDYELALMEISAAELMFTPKETSMSDGESVKKLYDLALQQVKQKEQGIEVANALKDIKDRYPDVYKENAEYRRTLSEQEILNGKYEELLKEKLIVKHIDYYKTKGIELAGKINKDYSDVINVEIMDAEDASGYLLTVLPENVRNNSDIKEQLQTILSGEANAFILTKEDILKIDPNYEGVGIAIGINDNIINNIKNNKSGNITASNAIHHEFEHLLFSLKYPGKEGTAKLTEFRNKIDQTLRTSKSPEMQAIYSFVNGRMMAYGKKGVDLNSRTGIEEYLAALGDACQSLGIEFDQLGTDFAANFNKIAEEFKNLIHPNEQTNNWTIKNTFDFLNGFESTVEGGIAPVVMMDENGNILMLDYEQSSLWNLSENIETFNTKDSFNGNKQSIVQSEEVALYRETVNMMYPDRQSMSKVERVESMKKVNSKIREDLKKAINDGNVNKEKRLRNELIWNNWSAFETLIGEWRTNEGLDLIPGNRDQFIGKALEQLIKATQTYDPLTKNPEYKDKEGDITFYSYYYTTGIAKRRLADIYDGLNQVFTVAIDENTEAGMNDTEIANYQADQIDAATVINEFNERSALREEMSKVVGFKVDSKMYNDWLNSVSTKLGDYDFASIFDPEASQDIRNMGKSLWRDLRNFSQADLEAKFFKKGKPTQQYIDLITNTIDVFYNQMSVRDLKKFLGDDASIFIETIEGRQNVENYLEAKGRDKAKNKYAGNSISSKNELTPELKEILLEKILQTKRIAQLKAEGKTNAEIQKEVRSDMKIEATMANYSSLLFNDAFMQVVTDDKFKEENGVDESQIAQAAILLDKGIDVKFQIDGGEKVYTIYADMIQDAGKFYQQAHQLLKIGRAQFETLDDLEATIGAIVAEAENIPGMQDGVLDLVVSMFDKGHAIDTSSNQYTNELKNNKHTKDHAPVEVWKKDEDTRKQVAKDSKYIALNILNNGELDILTFAMLGWESSNRKIDKGGSKKRYVDIIDPVTKEVTGRKQVQILDENDNPVTGEFYDLYNEMVESYDKNKANRKDIDLGLHDDGTKIQLKDLKLFNLAMAGKDNIMSRVADIFERATNEDGSIRTKQQKREEYINSGLAEEVKKATLAGQKMAKHIYMKLAEAIDSGKVEANSVFHILKMSGVLSIRGLAGIQSIKMVDGACVIDKGEHVKPMSVLNIEVSELIMRWTKDKSINLSAELDVLLSDFKQILGDKKDFDVLDDPTKGGSRTSTKNVYRINLWEQEVINSYSNAEGKSLRGIQTDELIDKQLKLDVLKTQKKAQTKINIRNSIASGKVTQGASVLDFDETLADGKNFIYAIKGKERIKIPSNEFHEKVDEFTKAGYEFNFDDFVNVRDAEKGPYFLKLQKLVQKYGTDNIYILTARQPGAAVAIQTWLKQNGVDLDIENINGLGVTDETTGKTKTVTGQDKADWIENNLILNGFDDILFADDGAKNVEAVKAMLDDYKEIINRGQSILVKPEIKYSVEMTDEEAKRNFVVLDSTGEMDLSKTFNKILELETGIEAYKTFSEAEGKIRGKGYKSVWDVLFPASAYDLEQFTYRYLGKGKIGEKQKQFFEDMLFTPFAEATININQERQRVTEGQKELLKKLPLIPKKLSTNIRDKRGKKTMWTQEHAVRVWLWNDRKVATAEDLGLAQETFDMLLKAVEADPMLKRFANELGVLSGHEKGYIEPSKYWTIEGVTQDLQRITSEGGRSKYLQQWKHNVDILFSEENLSKLEAAYGAKHVEALRDMLYRMEYGKNKNQAGRIETAWNNWVNNSVGAVMFLNTRSAVLQTISAANYIDYGDNNMIEAGKRVMNVPQFAKDIQKIFFSDYLKQRRSGNQRGINEAELAAAVEKGGPKAAVAWLLEKGFLPTQIADSFAIASGGATYYRSKIIAYEKQGMSAKEAEAKAWTDLLERTEANQQSSRADKISQQQAGGLGRVLLAFGNTPMQYNRIIMKAVMDLKNNRGKAVENIGKIGYYGAVQNAIFVTLQTALFAALGDDEDQWDKKTKRAANGMMDSLLKGMGLTGVTIMTVKNAYNQWQDQRKKGYNADHAYTVLQFANMSPTIGSKLRKLYSATQSEKFNQKLIDDMGFDINSPALNAIANLISATTNVPTDKALQKTQNILLAADSDVEVQDKIALVLGWNPWDLGIDDAAKRKKKELIQKSKEESFIETDPKKIKEEEKNIEEQKKERKEGKKDITCSHVNANGARCKTIVKGKGSRCTIHEKVKQRKDGKKIRCKHIKKSKKQCGVMTANESGLCYYHD